MKLEDIDEEDKRDISKLTKLKSVMKYVGNGKIWDSDKVDRFIEYNLEEVGMKNRKEYYYKITDKKFIGIIGIHPFLSFKGYYLSVMILPSEQKKGYYRKSMEKLKEKINKERIKTDRIKILVRTNNRRMISLCERNYYFDTERKVRGENFYEFHYFLTKYTYYFGLESKEENEMAGKILEKRGNWRPYNLKKDKNRVDFMYIYAGSKFDKRLFSLKSLLKNVTVKKGTNITNKNLLFEELEKIPSTRKYLVDNYYVNLNNLNMNKIKKMFQRHGVLIFKPVHGWKGIGIEIFDSFDSFEKYIFSKEFKESLFPIKNIPGKNIKDKKYNDWVLQEYIDNPMLLDGKKFHIRGYYLVHQNKKYLLKKRRNIYCKKEI